MVVCPRDHDAVLHHVGLPSLICVGDDRLGPIGSIKPPLRLPRLVCAFTTHNGKSGFGVMRDVMRQNA